ncbi:unnamed protein product [Durusdinium trenchii]
MHLAREGLKAPLSEGWKPCTNAENEIFYFNFQTGATSWTHPADEEYRNKVQDLKNARNGKPNLQNIVHAPYSGVGHRPVLGQSLGICDFLRRILCCRRRARVHCH